MIPKTNDELRLEFAKIYGRLPSVPELLQFKKNRPVSFFEPRRFKGKAKTLSKANLPQESTADTLPEDSASSSEPLTTSGLETPRETQR